MHALTSLRLRPLAQVLAALAFAALPLAATAQAVPPPNSGQLLQQVPPPPPPPPTENTPLTIEAPRAAAATDSTPFAVRHIALEGNTVVDDATLHALVADGEGRTLSLAQLDALAGRITHWYRAHGYPLARAMVPAQTLSDGTVRLRILEARYDTVQLDNHSRVDDAVLRATLAPLQPGTVVTQAALDRSLLMLGELPGVVPHATLRPGTAVGTSTLVVEAEPGAMMRGSVTMDDAGNRYTGRLRLGVNIDVNNPLHRGDQFSASALGGDGLNYARLAYQYVLNGHGTQVGASYSALGYRLGGPLKDLEAHGTAKVGSAWVSQPLLRSPTLRLDGRLQYDRKRLRDALDSASLHTDRHTDSWTAGLSGQHRDGWGGGGVTLADISVSRGRLGFDDRAAQAADAASARTRGAYLRWAASLARLQNLTAHTRLYLSVAGQHSGDNLDSSEQFLLGGAGSVRGYDVGVLAGASGWLGTLELRHDLDFALPGRCEVSAFVDHGALRINATPWTDAPNHAHLSSAGLGLNWAGSSQWSAQLQLAAPLGHVPTGKVGKQADARVWLQVARGF